MAAPTGHHSLGGATAQARRDIYICRDTDAVKRNNNFPEDHGASSAFPGTSSPFRPRARKEEEAFCWFFFHASQSSAARTALPGVYRKAMAATTPARRPASTREPPAVAASEVLLEPEAVVVGELPPAEEGLALSSPPLLLPLLSTSLQILLAVIWMAVW